MKDKTFELMSKIYAEMQDGFKRIDIEMQEIKKEMNEGFNEVRQDIVKLENKMDDNHKALYDGYVQNSENINKLQQEVEKLTDRVEHQEIKLQVVKGF